MLNDFIYPQSRDYQEVIDEFDHILFNVLKGKKISSLMTVEKNDSEENLKAKRLFLNETKVAQPAILLQSILNYKKFLKEENSKQFEVDSFFGPSLGEIIALVIAECIEYSQGAMLLYKRGECMQESCPQGVGAMLNVVGQATHSIEFFEKFKRSLNEEEASFINVSSINSNRLIVLSGKSELIDRCSKFMKENSIACKKLPVSAAFHSKLMTSGQLLFKEYINSPKNKIEQKKPQVSIISTIESGFYDKYKDSSEFDHKLKSLLVRQFLEPVNLLDCVRKNAQDKVKIYDMNKRKTVDFTEFL
jgi:[acyl-carrier-protein] S-malonyltransferase